MELLEKLKHLEENIKILEEIKESVSLEDLRMNKRYEWEVRYGLFESLQIVVDVSCKIASEYNLGNPKSYRECVELLVQNKLLSLELSKKIFAMVGLRNLLVHEYVEIDKDKLHSFLNYLNDFKFFIEEISSNLK